MVSAFQRHLSLLLVVITALSWFVMPFDTVKAQDATSGASGTTTNATATSLGSGQSVSDPTLEVAPTGYAPPKGYQFSYVNNPADKASIEFSWNRPLNLPGFSSVTQYRIQYMNNINLPSGMTDAACRSDANWYSLTSESEGTTDRTTRTERTARSQISSPAYFRLQIAAIHAISNAPIAAGPGGGGVPLSSNNNLTKPVTVACGTKTITPYNPNNPDAFEIQFTSNPTGASVTINNQTIDKVAGLHQPKTTTQVTVTYGVPPQVPLHINFHLDGYDDQSVDISPPFTTSYLVNANLAQTGSGNTGSATAQTNTGAAAGGVVGNKLVSIFKNVTNSPTTSLAQASGDLCLYDQGNGTCDAVGTGSTDPSNPPQIELGTAHTTLQNALIFTLTNLVRSSTTNWAGTQNNYFLFALKNLPDAAAQELKADGIPDPSKVYLAIDLSGNVAFLFDDPSRGGGIFSAGKTVIDTNSQDSPILVGNFNADTIDASHNAAGQSLSINLNEYRQTITKRVYNEANLTKTSDCAAVISYPNTNTSYDDSSFADHKNLPDSAHRNCIHVPNAGENPPGWLGKWGVVDTKIDQADSPCVRAFEAGGFLNGLVGKMICGVMDSSIKAATYIAGFSVDFLMTSVGLQ